jgi:WD40 repeat protein
LIRQSSHCCFSPDGKLIAAAAGGIAYVWDITSPDCCLVETFVGHTGISGALAFSSPSSLISVSDDNAVRFWQISSLPKNQTETNSEPAPLALSPIQSVSLQTTAGIAISSDTAGVVKTWDLSTGLCNASFQTPAGDCSWRDVQLIGGRLIIVWYKGSQIHIWDINKSELLQAVDVPLFDLKGFRISGDGSKVLCLTRNIN